MLAAKSALGLRVDALSSWGITSEDKGTEPTEEEKSQIGRDARLGIERRLRALEGKPLKSIPNANATALGSGQKWDVKEARKYNPDADGLTGEEPAAKKSKSDKVNGATPKKLVQEVDEDEEMADADAAEDSDDSSEEETKVSKGGDKAAKKAEKEAKKARKAERAAKRAEKEAKKAAKEAKKSKDSKKRKSDDDDTTEKKKKKKSKD
jgi:nucleolar protein 58